MRRALVLPLMAFLSACAAPAPDAAPTSLTERGTFRIEITHDDGAFRRGVNSLRVRAWDPSSGVAATLAEVTAEMPAHDHSRSVATVTAEGTHYAVDDLRLTMAGRWQINLRVAQGARSDVALVSVFVP